MPTVRGNTRRPQRLFQDSRVVLRGGKLYVQLSSYEGEQLHPFSGYFLPYPDSNFEGLVSTISDEPPQLNWIYLDTGSKSSQISHGLRAEAEEGLTGPWGARVCADGEIRFLMENWEGFIAVELETPGLWGLCSDRYDDGVKGKLGDEQRTVGLKLVREATNAAEPTKIPAIVKLSAGQHPCSAAAVQLMQARTDVSLSFDPIYTNFLIRNDIPFANECAKAHLFESQTLGGMTNMAQSFVAASERPLSAYSSRDENLDVDTYSWHECLQIIDDYEWSIPGPEPAKSLLVHEAHCTNAFLEISPISHGESLHQALSLPDASRNDVATLAMVRSAPAQQNNPTSAVATAEPDDTLVEKKIVNEYPPTPAMSVSELQGISQEAHNEPSPTTELEAIGKSDCGIEAPVATTPLSSRATSHYCPPAVTDQPKFDDRAQPVWSPSVPSMPSLCADDGQIILRPPQDFYRTYLVQEVVSVPPLLEHKLQASEKVQTAVASPPRTLTIKSAPVSLSVRPDTPPASPGTKLHENDLTSVMAALASCSSSAQLPTHNLNRSFITTEGGVDTLEKSAVNRQKVFGDEAVAEAVDAVVENPTSLRDTGLVTSGTETDGQPDMSDSVAHAISQLQEHTSQTVNEDVSNTPADLAVEELRPSPRGDDGGPVSSVTPEERLVGAYVQSPDMEERVTTVSRSPTFVSSVLSSDSSRSTLKSLESPVDLNAPIKSEADAQEEHNDSILEEHLSDAEEKEQQVDLDIQESDELSEADDEEVSLLANEVGTCPKDIQVMTPPIKESTPAPLVEAVDQGDSRKSSTARTTDDTTANQTANATRAVEPRHEAEFHYERRATRSETRTSDRGPGTTSSVDEETAPPPAPVIKEEDISASDKQTEERAMVKPNRRLARNPKTQTTKPQPETSRAEPTPKPPKAAQGASKPTRKVAPATKPLAKRTAAAAVKPKPKTMTPAPPKPPTDPTSKTSSAKAKTGAAMEGVLGKRKTRRSSALEEEIKKAQEAETNIAKRLRSKDAE
ncbi:hypothetical protein E8E11_002233 [Didymella keratinophila]|nr:hypothetical protein E8E11_002233 [Didymella keratinophila]